MLWIFSNHRFGLGYERITKSMTTTKQCLQALDTLHKRGRRKSSRYRSSAQNFDLNPVRTVPDPQTVVFK